MTTDTGVVHILVGNPSPWAFVSFTKTLCGMDVTDDVEVTGTLTYATCAECKRIRLAGQK